MKKFILEQPYLDIFPDSKIGILVCKGIDNHITDEDKYVDYLQNAQKEALKHITNPEFTENPIIRTWRDAFYKFKTKKGARCSIEAMLKRVSKGNSIGTIPIQPSLQWTQVNGMVDLNGIHALYLRFHGKGRIDLKTITFLEEDA